MSRGFIGHSIRTTLFTSPKNSSANVNSCTMIAEIYDKPNQQCFVASSRRFSFSSQSSGISWTELLFCWVRLIKIHKMCAPSKQRIHFISQFASSLAFYSHPNMKLRSSKRTTVSVSDASSYFFPFFLPGLVRSLHFFSKHSTFDLWRHEWADRLIFNILATKNERKQKISCDKVVGLETCLRRATACA